MKFWDTGEETNTTTFDYHIMKKKFIDNLNYLKTMSVQEQTLYKKWMEWNMDRVSNTGIFLHSNTADVKS